MLISTSGLSARVAFVVVYLFASAVVGACDSAYDAFVFSDAVARSDAERALSVGFDLVLAVGVVAMLTLRFESLPGGALFGLVVAYAAGGIHVLAYMGEWFPLAMAIGFIVASLLFAATRSPGASSLIGVLCALAATQVLFLVQMF